MEQSLNEALARLGLELPEPVKARLRAFGQAVLEQNRVMNLTAITDPREFARRHLADSLTVLLSAEVRGKRIIDVGCGAGFPGVPVKIACPEAQVTLLDSLGKRMNWLREVLPTLEVEAECVTGRAEELAPSRRGQYDIAVSRAVARLNILLELTAPFVRVGGLVLALKGPAAGEELAEAKNAMARLGLELDGVRVFPIGEAEHQVLRFRKVSPTPEKYPRKFAKIKQSPL